MNTTLTRDRLTAAEFRTIREHRATMYDAQEPIHSGLPPERTCDFLNDIVASIRYDPRRYPTAKQEYWVAHYFKKVQGAEAGQ